MDVPAVTLQGHRAPSVNTLARCWRARGLCVTYTPPARTGGGTEADTMGRGGAGHVPPDVTRPARSLGLEVSLPQGPGRPSANADAALCTGPGPPSPRWAGHPAAPIHAIRTPTPAGSVWPVPPTGVRPFYQALVPLITCVLGIGLVDGAQGAQTARPWRGRVFTALRGGLPGPVGP